MKKSLSLLCTAGLLCTLVACSEGGTANQSGENVANPAASTDASEPQASETSQSRAASEQPIPRLAQPLEGIVFDLESMPREQEFDWEFFMLTSTYDTALLDATIDAIDWYITREFLDIVSTEENSAWTESLRGYWGRPISSLMEYPNLFSFIVHFDLPVDRVRAVMNEQRLQRIESGTHAEHEELGIYNFTEEDIEIILTLDEAKVLERFATEYVIVHNGRGFSPSWIYWHSIEDYRAVGITPEMIAEKLPLYAELGFTDEARTAYEMKLSAFMGRDVVLPPPSATS
jgi:hypothetical protein